VELESLEVYQIARTLSKDGWDIYKTLKNENQFVIGQQFIRSIDSIGANIAEGFGRYHYMDSVKFYYNARGSLWESKHWIELMYERDLISEDDFKKFSENIRTLGLKLNNFILSIKTKVNKGRK
jgi:four helix bundle protein